jgi:hypothetical protein
MRGEALERLRAATHVLNTIPPVADMDRDPVLVFHRDDLFREGSPLRWAGYLSTTGVYGDHGGAWVDENRCLTFHRHHIHSIIRLASGSGGGGGNCSINIPYRGQ